jgi:hypothetical protein
MRGGYMHMKLSVKIMIVVAMMALAFIAISPTLNM